MTPSQPKRIASLIVLLLICYGAAGVGGALTARSVDDWYQQLNRPAWTPPDAVFSPVWTLLYTMMGVAAWLVWKRRPQRRVAVPMTLFGIQLALNVAWSGLFFAMQRPGLAAIEIVILWAAIVAAIVSFFRYSKPAGWLMVPYVLWVTYAASLNIALWQMN